MVRHPRRLALLAGIGLAVVAAVLLLRERRPEGYLLEADQVGIAREHLALRRELGDLEARIAAHAPADDAVGRSLAVARRLLAVEVSESRFADVPRDDLMRALDAADRGWFASTPGEAQMRAVYGTDDRSDLDEIERLLAGTQDAGKRDYWKAALDVARGVGAWIPGESVQPDGTFLGVVSLGEGMALCPGQKFASQPRAALGTAFLVAPDLVVTAKHVLKQAGDWQGLALVFDFELRQGANPTKVGPIYRPTEVVASGGDGKTFDWAVVRLDRAVAGGRVLELAEGSPGSGPRPDDELCLWGHSAGTPKKFMRGRATANDARANSFRAELDAFGGDSGSPVFDRSFRVVGLLFGGHTDWIRRDSCRSAAVLQGRQDGEYVTQARCFRAYVGRH
jgi:hypothetical protein